MQPGALLQSVSNGGRSHEDLKRPPNIADVMWTVAPIANLSKQLPSRAAARKSDKLDIARHETPILSQGTIDALLIVS